MKTTIVLMCLVLFTLSCGESKKERLERERIEQEAQRKEMIERETAKILVAYNEVISQYKEKVQAKIDAARFLGWNNRQMNFWWGFNWEEEIMDTLMVEHKLDSLHASFYIRFGEDEYNLLRLKVDENIDRKSQ